MNKENKEMTVIVILAVVSLAGLIAYSHFFPGPIVEEQKIHHANITIVNNESSIMTISYRLNTTTNESLVGWTNLSAKDSTLLQLSFTYVPKFVEVQISIGKWNDSPNVLPVVNETIKFTSADVSRTYVLSWSEIYGI